MAWLKAHYPAQFYAASLAKADEETAYKLMQDARAHGIDVRPPILGVSTRTWRPLTMDITATATGETTTSHYLVAGWEQVPGIGPKMAPRIDEYGPYDDWSQLIRVPGIGPKKIETIQNFANQPDPFQLTRTERILSSVRDWLAEQHRIPAPTHDGAELAAIYMEQDYGSDARRKYGQGPHVVYLGMVREINYQDAVENRRSRTGEEVEDILRTLKRPDLLAYCSIRCFDTTDEEVYLRVNRFSFPKLKKIIAGIRVNHDVIVAVGNRIAGFGTPVMAETIYVIDPQ
jgi:hypothetical protein